MKVIEITKKTNHKTEQIETLISILCLLDGIKLSKTDKLVLSYFVVYGLKEPTEKLLISSGVVKTLDDLRNRKTKLTKLGFLKRTKGLYKSYELNLSKDFKLDSNIRLYIKLDNS